MTVFWWELVFPGAAMASLLFALNFLGDGVKLLGDPAVAKHVRAVAPTRASTVRELVKSMAAQGLIFAPVGPGAEEAYVELHRILAGAAGGE